MEKSVSLSVCFELGKALRYSDAERFLSVYDSLLQDGSVEYDIQLIDVKEWSRQISELPQDDFTLLHTATLSSPNNTCDVSIATDEPVAFQLFGLIEKLRMTEIATSDSGAVSDFSESTDCKSHSSTSLTLEVEEREREGDHEIRARDVGVCEGSGFTKEGDDESKVSLSELEGVCVEVEGLNLQKERLVEPDMSTAKEGGGEKESISQTDKIPGSQAEESEKEKGELSPQKENNEKKDKEHQQNHKEDIIGKREEGKERVLPSNIEHLCHVPLAKSISKQSREPELTVPAKATVREEVHTVDDAQPFSFQRKTKRYYGSTWRKNYGCYGNGNYGNRSSSYRSNYSDGNYGNGRRRDYRSKFSPSSSKSHSQSSFNHGEVVRFLWKRWRTVEKEMSV